MSMVMQLLAPNISNINQLSIKFSSFGNNVNNIVGVDAHIDPRKNIISERGFYFN